MRKTLGQACRDRITRTRANNRHFRRQCLRCQRGRISERDDNVDFRCSQPFNIRGEGVTPSSFKLKVATFEKTILSQYLVDGLAPLLAFTNWPACEETNPVSLGLLCTGSKPPSAAGADTCNEFAPPHG